MHDFSFIDETLDSNLTHSYKLSIQVSLDGLSFCILDPLRDKYIALVYSEIKSSDFNEFLNAIQNLLDSIELLNYSYKSVKLNWQSTKNQLIPAELFQKDNLKQSFEFTQKLGDLDEIHYKLISYIDSYSVFTVPSQLATIFIRQFSNIQIYNQQIPFVEQVLIKHKSDETKLHVDVNNHFIDVAVSKNGKLLLYNNFVYKSEMDIVYYILNVFNQFNEKTKVAEVILSGNIDKKDQSFSKLKEFIEQIKFAKSAEDFTYSYTFKKIPIHTYNTLFSLNRCE